ncbi:YadA-like family protein [Fusobacterium nucleatum]|uniref:YadA-like family protein n=1 Tax=Fusobacterium nucleatum TaxID=851 RepID=UPI002361CD35|nr:YadA-like family protein [Fusobacterium nucleatum]WDD88042.1 YadA-like family protein [Fusobacterium nucleatum]
MKKSISLKLLIFSFLLIVNVTAFSDVSDPMIAKGSKEWSLIVGSQLQEANGDYSSAVGHNNHAIGNYASAFGIGNLIYGEGGNAFGSDNIIGKVTASGPDPSFGKDSMAFGAYNKVFGNDSGAFGIGVHNSEYINAGNNSYMIGNKNKIAAGTENNFILGNSASISSGVNDAVVLGNNSISGGSNTVSVGSSGQKRKIVYVADGEVSATSTDAVTGKQLYSGYGIDTNAWKAKLGVGSGGVDLTPYTKRDTSNLTASDISTWQTKLDVTKKVDYKDANNIDVNKWKTKLGVGSGGVDLTVYTKRDASNLTASDISAWKAKLGVGSGGGGGITNTATGAGSTGLGVDNTVTGNYSTAVGYKNKVSGNHSGAFGDPNIVTGNGSYAFGNDNKIAGDNNFVFGNNVTIEAGIQNSVALGNNSTVSSSNEVSVGSATQQRKITNVADGEVSATSTDAVTGRQLYKVMQNSGTTGIENLRNEVNEKIDDVKNEVNHVGSLSAALAGLHPMQYDPKAPAQVMAALGHYRNKQSVAVGLSYYFNDRFMMSAGVAIGSEKRVKSMANVGFTVKLGKGSGVTYNETPQYVVQNEVKRLTVENQDLKAKVNEQDEKIKNLEEKLNILLKNK